MHWIEEWMRGKCSMLQPSCYECRQMCAPKLILAQNARIPIRLIDDLLYSGDITHPNFADRIADYIGAAPEQRDSLVHEIHHGKYIPGKTIRKKSAAPKAERLANRRGAVVMIDSSGNELGRFHSVTAAAEYAKKGEKFISHRCNRLIGPTTNEFSALKASFRWAEAWDKLSREERVEDIRNPLRVAGPCSCSAMPKTYNYMGESHTLTEWARIADLPAKTLKKRIKNGWSMEDAIKTPLRSYGDRSKR